MYVKLLYVLYAATTVVCETDSAMHVCLLYCSYDLMLITIKIISINIILTDMLTYQYRIIF